MPAGVLPSRLFLILPTEHLLLPTSDDERSKAQEAASSTMIPAALPVETLCLQARGSGPEQEPQSSDPPRAHSRPMHAWDMTIAKEKPADGAAECEALASAAVILQHENPASSVEVEGDSTDASTVSSQALLKQGTGDID